MSCEELQELMLEFNCMELRIAARFLHLPLYVGAHVNLSCTWLTAERAHSTLDSAELTSRAGIGGEARLISRHYTCVICMAWQHQCAPSMTFDNDTLLSGMKYCQDS